MKIILISGKAEAGKTTTANMLKTYYEKAGKKVAIVPYGQYVKDTAKLLWGWDGQKDKKGRQLLQWWGTDIVRKKDENFWVNQVIHLATLVDDLVDYFIVDDCRFPNEIQAWKNNEKFSKNITTIRVERPGHENGLTSEQRLHPSETSLDNWEFDITVYANNLEELYEYIEYIVNHIIFN